MAVKAPQIQQRIPFVDKDGRLTKDAARTLNDAFKQQTALILQVANLAGVQLPDLNAAIEAANTAAANAQTAADTVTATSTLSVSGVSGLEMKGVDAGSDASITISAHNRIYGDGVSVALSAGSVTGLSYSTIYYVFYSDPGRAGGAVTYQASTDPDDAIQVGGIHSLGTVETPAALDPDSDGVPNLPPGVKPWLSSA